MTCSARSPSVEFVVIVRGRYLNPSVLLTVMSSLRFSVQRLSLKSLYDPGGAVEDLSSPASVRCLKTRTPAFSACVKHLIILLLFGIQRLRTIGRKTLWMPLSKSSGFETGSTSLTWPAPLRNMTRQSFFDFLMTVLNFLLSP